MSIQEPVAQGSKMQLKWRGTSAPTPTDIDMFDLQSHASKMPVRWSDGVHSNDSCTGCKCK